MDPLTASFQMPSNDRVELRILERIGRRDPRGAAPGYVFAVLSQPNMVEVGRVLLRVDDSPSIEQFQGHFGIEIESDHRRRGYAVSALELVAEVAALHGIQRLWAACATNNAASRRMLERAGFEFLDEADVPDGAQMRRNLDVQRVRRYRLELDALDREVTA